MSASEVDLPETHLVHELILKTGSIFQVGCPPSYIDFFADYYGSASLFFISTCFQLQ